MRPRLVAGRVIGITVMIVGIGFFSLLIGAVAQRFLAPAVEQVEDEVALEEADLLREVRQISARLQQAERSLARRRT